MLIPEKSCWIYMSGLVERMTRLATQTRSEKEAAGRDSRCGNLCVISMIFRTIILGNFRVDFDSFWIIF